MDRISDRSKGFGFVTYASEDEAEKALMEMNGKVSPFPLIYFSSSSNCNAISDFSRNLMGELFLWTMQSRDPEVPQMTCQ